MFEPTETETLETADAIEPPDAGTPAAPEPTTDAPRPKWGEIASQLRSEADDALDVTPPAVAPPVAPPVEPAKPETPAPDAGAKPPEAGKSRFEVVDAEGKPVAITLPEGAKVVFKADGKRVEASSIEQLVEYAQQGVHANRVRSEFGHVRSRLEGEIREAGTRITEAQARADRAEEILYEILTDPEKYDEVAAKVAPTLSPEARENARLSAELAKRDAEATQRSTEVQQQQATEFWSAARETVAEHLDKYDFLTADDTDEALQTFYGLYEQTRDQLAQQFKPQQARIGMSDADFSTAIEREAVAVLTTDNLLKVLEKLNARHEKRVRPHLDRARATSAADDAAKHNEKTTERLQRRDESVTLRRTAAPPASGTPSTDEPSRPRNFREHMQAIKHALHGETDD